jgi:4-hydroxybenzoyl-CoA thioesterase
MNHSFLHHRTVRFGECDPAGVVYYPIFFNWFHECMEVWFEEALQTPYAEVIQEIGFPAKSCEANFLRPIPVGSSITLVLSLSEIRQKGFCLIFDIYKEHLHHNTEIEQLSKSILATGKVVCVGIGVKEGEFQFRPMDIPSELRQKMSAYLQAK